MSQINIFVLAVFCLFATSHTCLAGHVNGYYRKDGAYVHSYERSDPNGTVRDNYSYKGNINPYTGAVGTDYYRHSPTSEYYQPEVSSPIIVPTYYRQPESVYQVFPASGASDGSFNSLIQEYPEVDDLGENPDQIDEEPQVDESGEEEESGDQE